MLRAPNQSCLDQFKYRKAPRSSFLALPHDVVRHIGLHLKPRHLYRLMRACRRLLRIVDCDAYWERAAAHAVLRHVNGLDPLAHSLFHLVNVDYRASIDTVIQRARQVFGHELSVAQLVRAKEAIILIDPDTYHQIHTAFTQGAATMKAVVKRETLRVLASQTSLQRKLRKFQRELDDELPTAAKTLVMGKLEALLKDVADDGFV